MKAFRTLICTGLHTVKAYNILLGVKQWAGLHPGCIHSEPMDWLVHRAAVTLVKDCSSSLSVPEVILHEDYAIGEQIGAFKYRWSHNEHVPPVVMADHPLKTCCMLFDSRNVLQDLCELIHTICSAANICYLDKDSYDDDVVTLTGKDRLKRRELYALQMAFAGTGKAELLPDDLYAEIVGAKCLDPIAAAAVDDIEMQIEEAEKTEEDSEENWMSKDKRVNELLEQLDDIMRNCAVRSRDRIQEQLEEKAKAQSRSTLR